nr:hypothetical protein [Pseudobdellovibrionaceae bacterium]
PSCGTGAVAAAVCFNLKSKTLDKNTKVKIAMPGGDLWVIGKGSQFQLRGETELICKAEVSL